MMNSKQRIVLFLLFFLGAAMSVYASECPTPQQVKCGEWLGFQAFDIDNGTLVAAERLRLFQAKVSQLTLVEWMRDAPEGALHCYYAGKQARDLNIFLAKENLLPTKDSYWIKMNASVWQCHPQNGPCLFEVIR